MESNKIYMIHLDHDIGRYHLIKFLNSIGGDDMARCQSKRV